MGWARAAIKGFRGHPLHPPLTDATLGAFTVGTIAAVLGWVGVFSDLVVPAAFVALVVGLVCAVPTVVTGLVDFAELPPAAPARTTALVHMGLMLLAALGFFVAAILLFPALDAGEVSGSAAGVAAVAFLLLAAGGWVGGSLAYVYGVRVVGDRDASPWQALRPRPPD